MVHWSGHTCGSVEAKGDLVGAVVVVGGVCLVAWQRARKMTRQILHHHGHPIDQIARQVSDASIQRIYPSTLARSFG